MMEKLDKLAIRIYNWVIITAVSIAVFIILRLFDDSDEEYTFKVTCQKVKEQLLEKQ